MQTIKLKFTKIEVPEFERKGFLPVRFHYEQNGEDKILEKQYGYVKEDPVAFAEDLIAEVRNKCRRNTNSNYTDDGVLSGFINVQLQEDREELTAERIANALKQLRDRIRNIKNMAHSENYMNKYVEVRGIVLEL
ncbi:MAG: hypothetical protein V1914_00210 [archaeon]